MSSPASSTQRCPGLTGWSRVLTSMISGPLPRSAITCSVTQPMFFSFTRFSSTSPGYSSMLIGLFFPCSAADRVHGGCDGVPDPGERRYRHFRLTPKWVLEVRPGRDGDLVSDGPERRRRRALRGGGVAGVGCANRHQGRALVRLVLLEVRRSGVGGDGGGAGGVEHQLDNGRGRGGGGGAFPPPFHEPSFARRRGGPLDHRLHDGACRDGDRGRSGGSCPVERMIDLCHYLVSLDSRIQDVGPVLVSFATRSSGRTLGLVFPYCFLHVPPWPVADLAAELASGCDRELPVEPFGSVVAVWFVQRVADSSA